MDTLEKYITDNRTGFDSEIPNLSVWVQIEKSLKPELDVETFVEDNRTAFDTEIPNLKIWSQIDKKANQDIEKRAVVRGQLRHVAAAVALLTVGAMVGFFFNKNQENTLADKQVKEIAPDFKNTEKFYNQQVQAKLIKLASYDNADPSVLSDLKQIDAVQEELKNELINAPSSTREEIVQRMIENHKIKLGILERVLENMEENQPDRYENKQKNVMRHDSI